MSHQSIHAATQDQPLQDRVVAAAQKEARNNATLSATEPGQQLRDNPNYGLTYFIWPVAIDYESEYAFAVDSDNPNPGGDPAVITDANISAAVQTHWPDA